jgi:hypothetical protein
MVIVMRLINADQLSEAIWDNVPAIYEDARCAKEDCLAEIEAAPTVDAVPVRHGHWISEQESNGNPYCFRCSVCGSDYNCIGTVDVTPAVHRRWEWFDEDTGTPLIVAAFDYCPNCGAKMKEVE